MKACPILFRVVTMVKTMMKMDLSTEMIHDCEFTIAVGPSSMTTW